MKIDYSDTEDAVYTYGKAGGAAGKIRSVTDAPGTLYCEYGRS